MADLQDLIRDMNSNAGVDVKPVSIQTQTIEEPVPATQEATEAKTATTEAASTQPQTVQESDLTDNEPLIRKLMRGEAVQNINPSEQAQLAVTQEGTIADTSAAEFSRLSALTNNTIKNEEDLKNFIDQHNSLLEQVQKGVQPKFENERARWAYDLLSKNTGKELETAQRTLQALNLKLESMPDREKLFNSFVLDPTNSDLTPMQMKEIFDAEYEQKYSDVENNVLLKRQHTLAVRQAEDSIRKVQADFQSTQQEPERISEETIGMITNAVNSFKEFKVKVSNNPQDDLVMPITDRAQIDNIQKWMVDPTERHNALMNKFVKNGKFDFDGYKMELYARDNHEAIVRAALEKGEKMGMLKKILRDNNATTPAELASKAKAAPILSSQPKSFMDALVTAEAANRRR
jgi:hypothetical protein